MKPWQWIAGGVGIVLAVVLIVLNVMSAKAPKPSPTPTGSASPVPTITQTVNPSQTPTTTTTPTPGDGYGEDGDGFDPNNPPKGAPSAAEVKEAMANAKSYWEELNSYGYGDVEVTGQSHPSMNAAVNSMIRRAAPYMTSENQMEWLDIADAAVGTAPDKTWQELVTNQRQNRVEVRDAVIFKWDANTLIVAMHYRTAVVAAGKSLGENEGNRAEVQVRMVRQNGKWLAADEVRVGATP